MKRRIAAIALCGCLAGGPAWRRSPNRRRRPPARCRRCPRRRRHQRRRMATRPRRRARRRSSPRRRTCPVRPPSTRSSRRRSCCRTIPWNRISSPRRMGMANPRPAHAPPGCVPFPLQISLRATSERGALRAWSSSLANATCNRVYCANATLGRIALNGSGLGKCRSHSFALPLAQGGNLASSHCCCGNNRDRIRQQVRFGQIAPESSCPTHQTAWRCARLARCRYPWLGRDKQVVWQPLRHGLTGRFACCLGVSDACSLLLFPDTLSSNSAIAANMWNRSFPVGVLVSIAWSSTWSATSLTSKRLRNAA